MLLVSKKTGFKTKSPFILIYEDGKPFYCRKTEGNKELVFNLPPGSYEVKEGEIEACEPVNYPMMNLPQASNPTELAKKLEIVWKDTPAKCQIDVYKGKVYIDPHFKKFPKYVVKWVFGHELGHFFYKGEGLKSEKECDIFSGNLLLHEGFNPSQIRSAIDLAISNKLTSACRKDNMLEHLKDIENGTKYSY